MKVATFPESWRSNPFLDLLEESISKIGVEFVKVGSDYLSARWILKMKGKVDILHFHWLQYHYLRDEELLSWLVLIKFFFKILLAKFYGYRIVWTMHNRLPHDKKHGNLDRMCYLLFAHLADSVVTLCETASVLLEKEYGRRKKVFPGYLGHYIGCYPDQTNQSEARKLLGISQSGKVFLYFGSLKLYKGIENLISSFNQYDNPNAWLIIVGNAVDDSYRDQVLKCIGSNPRIMPVIDWIPDKDVQFYFHACDFVVLPFTEVLTSSSAMLALSFGRPIVAPEIGCLPEIITPETGRLYDPEQTASLVAALHECTNLDAMIMGEKARQSALRFCWEDLAKVTLQAYKAT